MAKPTENKTALGIALDIEDETTGVPSSFHTVGTLYLDFASGYHMATIQSYFSKRVYELGKQPVGGGTGVAGGDGIRRRGQPVCRGAVGVR